MLLGKQPSVKFVAQHVGYRSVPQFSREYARIFGLPTLKDVAHLRKVINVRDNPWRRRRVKKSGNRFQTTNHLDRHHLIDRSGNFAAKHPVRR